MRDALLHLIPDPLDPTSQGIQRDAQLIGHRLSVINFHAPFVLVVLQDQLTTLDWQFT